MERMITIEFTCPMCGKKHYLTVEKYKFDRFLKRKETGEYVQDIFKDLSAVDREKFITQYCDECQELIFGGE